MREIKVTVLKVRRFKAGYELRTETWDLCNGDGPTTMPSMAYTPSGDFIGDSKWAYRLCVQRGIKPEKADPSHCVCSIGFSERLQKWYGWSHRAICGFQIGDEVGEDSTCASEGFTEEYLAEHPEERKALPVGFKAATLDDCRKMAVAFAAAVS